VALLKRAVNASRQHAVHNLGTDLDHIWFTVDRLSAGLFLLIGTGPKVPVISVSSVCLL